MISSADLHRLRGSLDDDTIFSQLSLHDPELATQAQSFRSAMPNMSPLAEAKFATAMLNKRYMGSFNPDGYVNPPLTEEIVNHGFSSSDLHFSGDQQPGFPDNPLFPQSTNQRSPGTTPLSSVHGPGEFAIGLAKNTVDSGVNFAKGLYNVVRHPLQAAENLGKLALGGGINLVETIAGNEQLFQDPFGAETLASGVGDFYVQRYGSLEKAEETAYQDPVGFMQDLSSALSLGGGMLQKGVSLATAGMDSVDLASTAGTIGRIGGKAVEIGNAINPTLLAARAVKGAISALSPTDMARKLVRSSMKLTPTQAQTFENKVGVPYEDWLLAHNLSQGTPDEIQAALEQMSAESKGTLDSALAGIPTRYGPAVADMADDVNIDPIQKSLAFLSDEYAKHPFGNEEKISQIADLQKTFLGDGLNLSEINELKRLMQGIEGVYKSTGDVAGSFAKKGIATVNSSLRQFVEDEAASAGVTQVHSMNQTTMAARELADAIAATAARRGSNNVLSLTDYILGGSAMAAAGPGTGVGTVIAKHLLGSPRLDLGLAQALAHLSTDDYYMVQQAAKTGIFLGKAKEILTGALREASRIAEDMPEIPSAIVPAAATSLTLPYRANGS